MKKLLTLSFTFIAFAQAEIVQFNNDDLQEPEAVSDSAIRSIKGVNSQGNGNGKGKDKGNKKEKETKSDQNDIPFQEDYLGQNFEELSYENGKSAKGNGKGNSKINGKCNGKSNGNANNKKKDPFPLQVQQLDFQKIDFAKNPKGKFKGWMKKFMRQYSPQEQSVRYSLFEHNINKVLKHNQKKSRFKMAVNKFGDLSDQQFTHIYLMLQEIDVKILMTAPPPPAQTLQADQFLTGEVYTGEAVETEANSTELKPLENQQVKNSKRLLQGFAFDWREHIDFSPIKDQGRCAACYAFSVIAATQLNYALKKSVKQPMLSEQQILDCCQVNGYKCNGCTSGSLGSSLQFLANLGIATKKDYPYVASVRSCKNTISRKNYLRTDRPYYQLTGVRNTLYYLVNGGPLTVAADSSTWKFYKQGVFDACPMSNFKFTHSVALIGVQSDESWVIRNSWGEDWGEQGYIRLASGNSCGITNYVFLPLIA